MIILVSVTLAEMMFAMGLRMNYTLLLREMRNTRWLLLRAMAVNFLIFPGLTLLIIVLSGIPAPVAAGLMILAVLPAAPYGLPFTLIANGNMPVATVLLFILAASSALFAPVLLHLLLPLASVSGTTWSVGPGNLFGNLFLIQLLPLCLGVFLTWWRPELAARLIKPAGLISKILNTLFISLIIFLQYKVLLDTGATELLLMLLVTVTGAILGWVAGWPGLANRKSVSLVTAMRNMSLAMGIAATSFPGSPVLSSIVAYSFVSGTALLGFSYLLRLTGKRVAR